MKSHCLSHIPHPKWHVSWFLRWDDGPVLVIPPSRTTSYLKRHLLRRFVLLGLPSDVFSTVVISWSTDGHQSSVNLLLRFYVWSHVSGDRSWSNQGAMSILMILSVWFGSQIKSSSMFSLFESFLFLTVTCGSLIHDSINNEKFIYIGNRCPNIFERLLYHGFM